MQTDSRIYKIQLRDTSLSVTLDSSYIAENVYKTETYVPKIEGRHYHTIYELFFIADEPLTLCIGGEEREYSGCVLAIPPFLEHYAVRSTDHRMTVDIKGGLKKDAPIALPMPPEVLMYTKKLEKHFFDGGEYGDEIISSYLKLIFCALASQEGKCDRSRRVIKNESYLAKLEDIFFDFRSDISLSTVAEKLCLSEKQTARIIRKNYDSTLSELVCKKRLSCAANLLESSDMTVAEIAEYVNFSSESYFYSTFKKVYGTTPHKYRKAAR